MSDTAVMDAPPTEAVAPAPTIPSGSLLGGFGGDTPPPAASVPPADTTVLPITEGPGNTPPIESPYWAKLVADHPDLKQYESTLAHFQKPISAEEFAKETAKGYAEAVKFKGILVPGAEAAEKDIATYRKVNGIPAGVTEYKLSEGTEKILDSMGVKDPALKEAYIKAAHEANITPAQFEKLAEQHGKVVESLTSKMQAESTADQSANIAALRKEWGDRANAKHGDAQKLHDVALVGVNLTESEQRDMDKFIGTTAYTKLLASISERIPKEAMIHNGAAAIFQSSASKFQQVKEAMATNPKHPVLDATHPNHAVEFERFVQLEKEARGVF